jgi:hypothetical protein
MRKRTFALSLAPSGAFSSGFTPLASLSPAAPAAGNSLAAMLRNYLPRQREILSAKQNLSLSPAQRVIDEFSSARGILLPYEWLF